MTNIYHRRVFWVLFRVGIVATVCLLSTSAHLPAAKTVPSEPLTMAQQIQATGPLRVNAANPRYFADNSGKAKYLTGSHTWANLQDLGYVDPPPVFDYSAYLDFLQSSHHNFFRLWAWEQSIEITGNPENAWFSPSPYQRPGPGTALDGKPKFDLNNFDQAYFDRMRSRIISAGDRGIYVSVMLFNGFSVGEKPSSPADPWAGHPFNAGNNINGINGDPDNDGNGYEIDTLAIRTVTSFQEAYVRKVIDAVNDLDNVLYEICNECNQDSTEWQYHMIGFIHNYEATKPKRHPVGMTVAYPNGSNADLFNSPADWISPNSEGGYQDNPPAADGSKVVIVDTDHLWGIGGDRKWAWKSFTRGLNPILMDCYNSIYCEEAQSDPEDPIWVSLRHNLGYTLAYAERLNLAEMIPRPDLCSTGYCLTNPIAEGAEYLVYLPNGGKVSVDLSGTPTDLSVEWFDPQNETTVDAATVSGGDTQTFSAPFSGDAVLYIYDMDAPTPTSTIPPSSTLTQTSTMPTGTWTPTSLPPTPTPLTPTGPLPCAQGLLFLGGAFLVIVRSGSLDKKKR